MRGTWQESGEGSPLASGLEGGDTEAGAGSKSLVSLGQLDREPEQAKQTP